MMCGFLALSCHGSTQGGDAVIPTAWLPWEWCVLVSFSKHHSHTCFGEG